MGCEDATKRQIFYFSWTSLLAAEAFPAAPVPAPLLSHLYLADCPHLPKETGHLLGDVDEAGVSESD